MDMVLYSHVQRRETSITILPEEIIFDILMRLPADILYNVMRYVCRQWHMIIEDPHFVSTHLLLPASALLMHFSEMSLYRLLDMKECDFKLTDVKFQLPSDATVMSTCNGLLLMFGKQIRVAHNVYYIGNPITHRILALPPLSLPIFPYYCGLAFEASSKVYKVVVIYEDYILSSRWRCAILTVGVDKEWRTLNCTHYKNMDKDKNMTLILRPPLTSTGFMYWISDFSPYILALDVQFESMKTISLPCACGRLNRFMLKGNSISFCNVNSDFSMQVWLLKDHITEEWVKFLYIEGEPLRNEFANLLLRNEICQRSDHYRWIDLICWLGNGEKILIDIALYGYQFYVYDVKTHSFSEVALENGKYRLIPFVNSLAWI